MEDQFIKFKIVLEFRGDDSICNVITAFLLHAKSFEIPMSYQGAPPTFYRCELESPIEIDKCKSIEK